MRIISFNANGIRAAARKGFFDWLQKVGADVVCVQETKAQEHQLDPEIHFPDDYSCYYHDAEKKGYSGVAIYSRVEPEEVIDGIGWEDFDAEGRWIEARFRDVAVVSLYLPSGSSSETRQEVKFDIMDRMESELRNIRRRKREYIICGDWNIAHRKIDIRNWRSNQKNSGFLPEERAWMDQLFGPWGYVDAFREVDPRPDRYTWWSQRGGARERNVGWRIDYQVVTPGLKDRIRAADIYTDENFSDHAPLILDYEGELQGVA